MGQIYYNQVMDIVVVIEDSAEDFELINRTLLKHKEQVSVVWYQKFTHARKYIELMGDKIKMITTDLHGTSFFNEAKEEIQKIKHRNIVICSGAVKPDWTNGNFLPKEKIKEELVKHLDK